MHDFAHQNIANLAKAADSPADLVSRCWQIIANAILNIAERTRTAPVIAKQFFIFRRYRCS